jgi:hypothetical protein
LQQTPNGLRYPLVGGLRLAVETEKTQRQKTLKKNAPRTHLSTARCVGLPLALIVMEFDTNPMTPNMMRD